MQKLQRAARLFHTWSSGDYTRTDIHNPELIDLKVGDHLRFTYFGHKSQIGQVEAIEGDKIRTFIFQGGTMQRDLLIDITRINMSWPSGE